MVSKNTIKSGRFSFDRIPAAKREKMIADIVLGRLTMHAAAKVVGCSDTAIGRYMKTVTEEERLHIIAGAMSKKKLDEAQAAADVMNEFGDDVEKDLKFVLHELKMLLSDAKGDEDRVMQLGSLKELRQALMSLAELSGKLNKKVEISLNLNESPQFIELRKIILRVLDHHPEAKRDFLQEMRTLNVIDAKAIPA